MRYIIGIDLGTTNCCVSYIDTQHPTQTIQPFHIPQITAAGYVEHCSSLPSFYYISSKQEWPPGSLDLPWKRFDNHFVGHFAKDQGAKTPTRLVQSAKSWLCHAAANRRDKILPIESPDRSVCLSPIEATAAYLKHIKEAWDHHMAQNDPEAEFTAQDIVITVPASFDEVARRLTVEAAKAAGYTNMSLLEEPQAAFYSWLATHEATWNTQFKPGQKILVCDVGGGTTDFSLMEVISREGQLSIQRMAVGDHLLLGGDNMDAALAAYLAEKLRAQRSSELSTTQMLQLHHQARQAKETLLNPIEPAESYKVIIQGSGSSVVEGSISIEVQRHEVEKLLLEGFFTQLPWEKATQIHKARGLRTMGLPFEDDPSITKHLAYFLLQSQSKNPQYLLFNGGTMKAKAFQDAILKALKTWFPDSNITMLSSDSLDFAVGRGAAYHGKVRRGLGVRIHGGMARGYYLGIADESGTEKALTLLPRGCAEETEYESIQPLLLTANTPVAFHLYTSHVRLHDKPGDLIDIDPNEMQLLPPIHTILRFGKSQAFATTQEKLKVALGIKLTAIGTLEIWLKSKNSDHRWDLEFQLRSASGQDNSMTSLDQVRKDETFDSNFLNAAKEELSNLFLGKSVIPPKNIMENLEKQLALPRREWPLSALRGLADIVFKHAPHRKKNLEIEARWWNLTGFLLRPGFGYPLDDFRLKEFWKVILADSKTTRQPDLLIQNWICFRRIAGGLNKGQQMQLASELWPTVISKKSGKIEIKSKGDLYPYSEKIRALGALELIDTPLKIKMGNAILEKIVSGEGVEADFWALGRIGSRHLLYGSAANAIPKEICEKWLQELLKGDFQASVFAQLARKTDQEHLNISQGIVKQILLRFPQHEQVLCNTVHMTQEEQEHSFGDRLPLGLTLFED